LKKSRTTMAKWGNCRIGGTRIRARGRGPEITHKSLRAVRGVSEGQTKKKKKKHTLENWI